VCTPVRGTVSEPFSSGVCEDRREGVSGASVVFLPCRAGQDERPWGLRKGRERRQDERTGDDVTRSTDRRMGRNGEGIHRESYKTHNHHHQVQCLKTSRMFPTDNTRKKRSTQQERSRRRRVGTDSGLPFSISVARWSSAPRWTFVCLFFLRVCV